MRRKSDSTPFEDWPDELLLKAAGRDPDAFGVFYQRHARGIMTFFVKRTASSETAADLAAETFAQAFLSRGRYKPSPAPATAWLFAIARHQLSHFVRDARVAASARQRLGMAVPTVTDDLDRVEDLADLELHRSAIRRAVDGLSEALGDAVRFRVVDGLAYAEVAERLGCSEATARQRVARGLGQLAGSLEVLR